MVIQDLFFKRQRRARGEDVDVFQYEKLPQRLLVQIIHVWGEVLGTERSFSREDRVTNAYQYLVSTLRKELGVFTLPNATRNDDVFKEWFNEFLRQEDIEIQLSMVELANNLMLSYCSNYDYRSNSHAAEIVDGAIEEINLRLQENGVGFQYTDGEIVRVDSQFVHAEVVKPALSLLRGKDFAGAQAEFLKAHEEYRQGDTKGALSESLKALESVMKVICKKRGWKYDASSTSKHLINILFEQKLIPEYWQSHFAGLRTTLESGVPTARNKDGGHGQGVDIKTVPMHLAGYVLHQTAAAIVFLVEAELALS